jgi:putative colanic acid biosynthesis glycosyltransferase WcaI
MRIAIHDYAGFPFPLELSSELSKKGHDVLHLFTYASGGPKASFEERQTDRLKIVNIRTKRVEKDNFLKRWMQERHYGSLAINELAAWQPDFILSGNTPLEAQRKIGAWAKERAIPFVYWLHDLLSIAARSIIHRCNRTLSRFVYTYLNKLEIDTLRKANHIVSISDDFIPVLNQWEIPPHRISLIPNWGPIERIPVLPRKNWFSKRYGLDEHFVVLYAGTLGKKQGIQLIADAVDRLAGERDIRFVVATDPRGHRFLERRLPGKALPNLLKLPLQPSPHYPYLLASADVLLVTLDASAGKYCVPSKLWSAYCAQRPSIVAVDRRNLSARMTRQINAGIVVAPGSADECIAAIKELKSDRTLGGMMGNNARRYAVTHFPISRIANAFEKIVHQVVSDCTFPPIGFVQK